MVPCRRGRKVREKGEFDMEWMLMPFRRYADFSGRSRRKEFWMFQLLGLIVGAVIYALILGGGGLDLLMASAATDGSAAGPNLDGVSFGPVFWVGCILAVVWALGAFIPALAVSVRRLHDRNMSGWYLLGLIGAVIVLSMIPILGALAVLALEIGWIVLMALPGTPGPNTYGPDPLGQADPEVFA
jgi:uncharacterized membrane protein YhaH (DUF805 family)